MKKSRKNAFDIEDLRGKLAGSRKYVDFRKTYTAKFPEIPDLNTPKLWDELNNRQQISRQESPMTFHKLKIISGYIQDVPIKVLNIGCGGGDLEHVIFGKEKNIKVKWFGVDISPKSISKCKKAFPEARFSVGNIKDLKFRNQSFDLVILMEILEHIRAHDTFKALSEVKRVLKKRGKLIISIPLNEGLPEMIKRGQNPNAHVRAYSPEVIRTEMKLAGFKIIKENFLYAFQRYYFLKTFIVKFILKGFRKPNNMIIYAEKL